MAKTMLHHRNVKRNWEGGDKSLRCRRLGRCGDNEFSREGTGSRPLRLHDADAGVTCRMRRRFKRLSSVNTEEVRAHRPAGE
jgi:hypothetical protein